MAPIPILFCFLSAEVAPANTWFADCVRAHKAMNASTVRLQVEQLLDGKKVTIRYDLAYRRPNEILLHVVEPEQAQRGASDRTFAIVGGKFFGFDAVVFERMERKAPAGTNLAEKLAATVGKLDDSVVALIDSDKLAEFIKPFQESKGWAVKSAGGTTNLSKRSTSGGPPNTTTWRFETKTKRLAGLRIDTANGRLEWTLKYGAPPGPINWRPPAGAAVVRSFTARPPGARYPNAKTRQVAERSMKAYDLLRSVNFRIEGAGGGSKVWISNGRVREEGSRLTYVWDGKNAFVKDAGKRRYYSGKCGLNNLIDALATLGSRIDPQVRQIIARENPMRVLLGPGIEVRLRGQMGAGGAVGDILEFEGRTGRVTMVVRQDNGLLASLQTELFDSGGGILSRTEKTFRYGSVGKPLEASIFRLEAPTGFERLPISTLFTKPS